MNVAPSFDLQGAREHIRALETERRNPRRRSLFWDSDQWQGVFSTIVDFERTRDYDIRGRIDATRASTRAGEANRLLQQRYNSLEESIDWHKALLSSLRALRERWETDQAIDDVEAETLDRHISLVDYHLKERRVWLAQTALEVLEEQRRVRGRVGDHWIANWAKLRGAFRAYDAAYFQTFGQPPAPPSYTERLRWCRALRARQADTARVARRLRNFDPEDLRPATIRVEALIAELSPQRRLPFDRAAIVGIGVVLVVFVTFFVVITRSADSRLVLSPTKIPPQGKGLATTTTPTVAVDQPDAVALNDRGMALLRENSCAKAVPLFRQAAQANPQWHEPLNNMAFCLYDLGQRDEAIAQWQAAIALLPESQDAHAGLGMALFQAGRTDEGIAEYRKAIELGGNYRDEAWIRRERFWSDKALADSQPLRVIVGP